MARSKSSVAIEEDLVVAVTFVGKNVGPCHAGCCCIDCLDDDDKVRVVPWIDRDELPRGSARIVLRSGPLQHQRTCQCFESDFMLNTDGCDLAKQFLRGYRSR